MRTIGFSAARANLKAVLDSVVEDRAPVAIVRQAAEGVVMVSASEWAAIEETLHLLAPGNVARLAESVAELESAGGDTGDDR